MQTLTDSLHNQNDLDNIQEQMAYHISVTPQTLIGLWEIYNIILMIMILILMILYQQLAITVTCVLETFIF